MKVGFTGTKKGMTIPQRHTFCALLKHLVELSIIKEFHHGDCVGADEHAHIMIMHSGVFGVFLRPHLVIHPPANDRLRAFCEYPDETRDPLPYLDRNHKIVDETDILIATPAGKEQLRSGTWATVRYAGKKKKPIYLIDPEGNLTVTFPKLSIQIP